MGWVLGNKGEGRGCGGGEGGEEREGKGNSGDGRKKRGREGGREEGERSAIMLLPCCTQSGPQSTWRSCSPWLAT